ncbi:hypothetical protein RI367_008649 [Sorochytrium milnesiophthora]
MGRYGDVLHQCRESTKLYAASATKDGANQAIERGVSLHGQALTIVEVKNPKLPDVNTAVKVTSLSRNAT